jgi:hypothetical protein
MSLAERFKKECPLSCWSVGRADAESVTAFLEKVYFDWASSLPHRFEKNQRILERHRLVIESVH